MHTTYSDGHNSVQEVLAHAADHTDLRVIAITDHDTIAGALEARRLAPAYGLEVIVGEEVSTADGHLLVLFLEQCLPPGRPAAETIAAAHAQGALCIAAHPYDWMVPSLGRRGLAARCASEWPLDAIEAFNASLTLPANNGRALLETERLGLASVGGSDSHHVATIGTGYTHFPGLTAADLRRAIVQRQTQAGGTGWNLRHHVEIVALLARRGLFASLPQRAQSTQSLGDEVTR
ncbi:MAG: PHP domain-containing protein [Chloroflexaceae bacterium]|nr:PHP domain-containing protein [Chloroflexaceae bacterium]